MSGGGEAGPSHGGSLDEARCRFPGAPGFIDLSTGINPVPYPFTPPPPDAFTRLPEPAALRTLQAAAARAYGLSDPAMVVAAPGTQVLINLLPRLFPQHAVAVLSPTYAEHARAWSAAGAAVDRVADFGQLAGRAAAVLCNPNNPDGRRHARDAVEGLGAGLLVVDEAFADFDGPGVRPGGGTVVLRSFGKAYGLAGVRLGFALASPACAATLRAALGPWAVGGPALHIGRQALADTAWRDAAGTRLQADAARLDALLTGCGLGVVGGTRLFRLAEAADAPARFDRLGRAGVFVRAFPERPRWLRFGIPAPADWPRLEAALAA